MVEQITDEDVRQFLNQLGFQDGLDTELVDFLALLKSSYISNQREEVDDELIEKLQLEIHRAINHTIERKTGGPSTAVHNILLAMWSTWLDYQDQLVFQFLDGKPEFEDEKYG